MKIAIIGTGDIISGCAIHEAMKHLQHIEPGTHEVLLVENEKQIKGLYDLVFETPAQVNYSYQEAPLTKHKPPGRRRGQRKGNYHWSK